MTGQRYDVFVSNNDWDGSYYDTREDAKAFVEQYLLPDYELVEQIGEYMWECSWHTPEENLHGAGNLIHVADVEEPWLLEVTSPSGACVSSEEFTSLYCVAEGAYEEDVAQYAWEGSGYRVVLCRLDEDTGSLDEWVVVLDSETGQSQEVAHADQDSDYYYTTY